MKVLLVGSGGREHAIAAKLLRDDPGLELIAAPGNAGIAEIAECIPVKVTDIRGLSGFARRAGMDLTVVGPEGPLADGIVDVFTSEGSSIFGPTAAAAEIETSKRFAKQLMDAAGVPTARATCHTDALDARAAIQRLGAPVVIKASGLAAGKGVVVARSSEEAERAIDMMLRDRLFGDASSEILVEEFMDGEELSVFGITDGTNVMPMLPAQDHKRLLDGDIGPNTGGMGAYAPVSLATPAVVDAVTSMIFEPTLRALRDCGRPFTGLLRRRHAHGGRAEGGRVQLPFRRSRDPGDPAAHAQFPSRPHAGRRRRWLAGGPRGNCMGAHVFGCHRAGCARVP